MNKSWAILTGVTSLFCECIAGFVSWCTFSSNIKGSMKGLLKYHYSPVYLLPFSYFRISTKPFDVNISVVKVRIPKLLMLSQTHGCSTCLLSVCPRKWTRIYQKTGATGSISRSYHHLIGFTVSQGDPACRVNMHLFTRQSGG